MAKTAQAKGEKPAMATEVKKEGPLRVKATALGYYANVRQKPGTIFTIKSEKEFSSHWMAKLTSKPAPAVEVEETADEAGKRQDESVI